jgi:hypothetical protein
MKIARLSFLAFSLSLFAQSPGGAAPDLRGDLQNLRAGAPATPALTRQVGTHILLFAERTHEPKSSTLQQFSESLVTALAGHSAAQTDIDRLAADIEQTMRSAGTSTIAFEQTIQDFEKRLQRAGVSAVRSHLVASNLEHIGREVRGPEGAPVR